MADADNPRQRVPTAERAMNTNPAGRIASIHSGQKPPRSTTFLRPHQVRPGAERAVHTPHCNSHKARCQPVRTTYSQVTALLTLDNRALSRVTKPIRLTWRLKARATGPLPNVRKRTWTPVVAVPLSEPQSERRWLDPVACASMIDNVPQGIRLRTPAADAGLGLVPCGPGRVWR